MARNKKYRRISQESTLDIAIDQYHQWDSMVFNCKDGVPPLVNVKLTAYTMDFFLRETHLLKLLFASNPSSASSTNTNMATVLYDKDRLAGIAIEYGDNGKAYIAMDKLDAGQFGDLPDWQKEPGLHAAVMRTRIRAYTGMDIGLIKCADLEGFFGALGRVVKNENTLEMLLEGVKFACNAVAAGHLSIQPEPRFFEHLRFLHAFTAEMNTKELAENISDYLPDFTLGLVLQNREKQFASVELYAEKGRLGFHDYGDLIPVRHLGVPLKEAAKDVNEEFEQNLTIGLSTGFIYNAMHAALTHSPCKLGKAVYNAVRNEEIVIC